MKRWAERAFLGVCAALIMAVVLVAGSSVEQPEGSALSWRQREILHVRGRVHGCQHELRTARSPVADRIVTGGPRYRAWVLRRWQWRERFFCGSVRALNANPVRAIHYVFGPHAWEAVEVSDCETGGTFSVGATNGQYRGLFQMGESERATYGHGSTPLAQAWAAKAYFDDSGQDWSPWDPRCQP
jgi:hypothetical protein